MARFKTRRFADKKLFKRTATRTRGENMPRGIVPRGGTRH